MAMHRCIDKIEQMVEGKSKTNKTQRKKVRLRPVQKVNQEISETGFRRHTVIWSI
jgi:hypothetical protein